MPSVADRTAIDVPSPSGGWGAPRPNVAEIETVLPHEKWTLVGGLMAQLHGIHRGIDALRPTNDIDIVLHVETTRGVASEAARALESIGYVFSPSIDDRNSIAHRFTRSESRVDLGALIFKAAAYRTISRQGTPPSGCGASAGGHRGPLCGAWGSSQVRTSHG